MIHPLGVLPVRRVGEQFGDVVKKPAAYAEPGTVLVRTSPVEEGAGVDGGEVVVEAAGVRESEDVAGSVEGPVTGVGSVRPRAERSFAFPSSSASFSSVSELAARFLLCLEGADWTLAVITFPPPGAAPLFFFRSPATTGGDYMWLNCPCGRTPGTGSDLARALLAAAWTGG